MIRKGVDQTAMMYRLTCASLILEYEINMFSNDETHMNGKNNDRMNVLINNE